ncbi:MAG: VOC family protein [Myxococcales bacterium]|nr:VOC family protein [Myxococcales bacterium]
MRIRQIALVAKDLEPTVLTLCSVLGLEVAFRDPGVSVFGLSNVVIPVGDTFLEVVSPVEEDTAAGRLLDRRLGDGGYMVILQTEDLDVHRKQLAEIGVRITFEHALEDIATIHLHPKDVGGAILSLDVAKPPSSWHWAGPDWESHRLTHTTCWIDGVQIQTSAMRETAERWSRITGHPIIDAIDGGIEIPLEAGCLRFTRARDGRGDGVCAVDLIVHDVDEVIGRARRHGLETHANEFTACGTRMVLREA